MRSLTDLPTIDEFRVRALGYWQQVAAGDSRKATRETRASEAIVDAWKTAGVEREFLMPLLSDPSEEVRYAAAALLGPGSPDALNELRALAETASGLIAPTAKLLLRTWPS